MAVLALAGGTSVAEAAPSIAIPNVTIFLTNASSYCADVKNSVNRSGTTIWLYKCSLGRSEHWFEVDGLECGNLGIFVCSVFVDTRNTSVCMSMNGARNVVLAGCGNHGNSYTTAEEWIMDTGPEDGWRNFNWGPNGDLAVARDRSGYKLYGTDASNGCGGCWFRWSDS